MRRCVIQWVKGQMFKTLFKPNWKFIRFCNASLKIIFSVTVETLITEPMLINNALLYPFVHFSNKCLLLAYWVVDIVPGLKDK